MVLIIKCDRCGKTNEGMKEGMFASAENLTNNRMSCHLCPTCNAELKKIKDRHFEAEKKELLEWWGSIKKKI